VRGVAWILVCAMIHSGCAMFPPSPYKPGGSDIVAECSTPLENRGDITNIVNNFGATPWSWLDPTFREFARQAPENIRATATLIAAIVGGVAGGGASVIFTTIPGIIEKSTGLVKVLTKFKSQDSNHEWDKLAVPHGKNLYFKGKLGNCLEGEIIIHDGILPIQGGSASA